MPSGWLNVPHFRQEHEYSCVAACVRMVLAHFGQGRTEAELFLITSCVLFSAFIPLPYPPNRPPPGRARLANFGRGDLTAAQARATLLTIEWSAPDGQRGRRTNSYPKG